MKLAEVRRKLERVDRAVHKAIEKGEIPGAVMLARQGEELRYEAAIGAAVLAPERHEARMTTRYDLASVTKVMATTAATMLLVADSKLQLDGRVADVLPAFAERGKDEITLRQLLTHSSGLRPWRAYHADLRERELRKGETLLCTEAGRQSIVDRILRSAPVHDPGEASVYGDLGFIVLGELIERVAGEPLDAYCQRRIYEPHRHAQRAVEVLLAGGALARAERRVSHRFRGPA